MNTKHFPELNTPLHDYYCRVADKMAKRNLSAEKENRILALLDSRVKLLYAASNTPLRK